MIGDRKEPNLREVPEKNLEEGVDLEIDALVVEKRREEGLAKAAMEVGN